MIQNRRTSSCQQAHTSHQKQGPLLQRYPVSLPIFLVSSAITLVISSYFADAIFPVSKLIGAPAALICLLLACVLGICGVLTTIISVIEYIDRQKLPISLFSHAKEHCYDRN